MHVRPGRARSAGPVAVAETPVVRTPGGPRLLLVHAHPDDETLDNGATMAAVTAAGGHVTLVTCTLGEEGEVIGDGHADLVSEQRDELGAHRLRELAAAMAALGVEDHRMLGGVGRYRDTGMVVLAGGRAAVPPDVRPGCFAAADLDEAAGLLADVVREVRPHVVVTYEPGGGYGHPDHVMAHRVTLRAVELAAMAATAEQAELGATGVAPWQVPKVYATVRSEPAMRTWLRAQPPSTGAWDPDGPLASVFVLESGITAVVDASPQHAAKAAALRAHATQVTVLDDRPGAGVLALSNRVPQPWSAMETYRLLRGVPSGPVDDRGRETDLFAGTR